MIPADNPGIGADLADYYATMAKLSPREKEIARQRQMVAGLRKMGEQPQDGRMVGQVYVARNPLEHIAGLAAQGLGSYREHQANQAQTGYEGERMKALEELQRRLQRKAPGAAGGLQQLGGPGVDEYDPTAGYPSPL